MSPPFHAQIEGCIYGVETSVITCPQEVQNSPLQVKWSSQFFGTPKGFVAGLFGGWNHHCYAVLLHPVEIEGDNSEKEAWPSHIWRSVVG